MGKREKAGAPASDRLFDIRAGKNAEQNQANQEHNLTLQQHQDFNTNWHACFSVGERIILRNRKRTNDAYPALPLSLSKKGFDTAWWDRGVRLGILFDD